MAKATGTKINEYRKITKFNDNPTFERMYSLIQAQKRDDDDFSTPYDDVKEEYLADLGQSPVDGADADSYKHLYRELYLYQIMEYFDNVYRKDYEDRLAGIKDENKKNLTAHSHGIPLEVKKYFRNDICDRILNYCLDYNRQLYMRKAKDVNNHEPFKSVYDEDIIIKALFESEFMSYVKDNYTGPYDKSKGDTSYFDARIKSDWLSDDGSVPSVRARINAEARSWTIDNNMGGDAEGKPLALAVSPCDPLFSEFSAFVAHEHIGVIVSRNTDSRENGGHNTYTDFIRCDVAGNPVGINGMIPIDYNKFRDDEQLFSSDGELPLFGVSVNENGQVSADGVDNVGRLSDIREFYNKLSFYGTLPDKHVRDSSKPVKYDSNVEYDLHVDSDSKNDKDKNVDFKGSAKAILRRTDRAALGMSYLSRFITSDDSRRDISRALSNMNSTSRNIENKFPSYMTDDDKVRQYEFARDVCEYFSGRGMTFSLEARNNNSIVLVLIDPNKSGRSARGAEIRLIDPTEPVRRGTIYDRGHTIRLGYADMSKGKETDVDFSDSVGTFDKQKGQFSMPGTDLAADSLLEYYNKFMSNDIPMNMVKYYFGETVNVLNDDGARAYGKNGVVAASSVGANVVGAYANEIVDNSRGERSFIAGTKFTPTTSSTVSGNNNSILLAKSSVGLPGGKVGSVDIKVMVNSSVSSNYKDSVAANTLLITKRIRDNGISFEFNRSTARDPRVNAWFRNIEMSTDIMKAYTSQRTDVSDLESDVLNKRVLLQSDLILVDDADRRTVDNVLANKLIVDKSDSRYYIEQSIKSAIDRVRKNAEYSSDIDVLKQVGLCAAYNAKLNRDTQDYLRNYLDSFPTDEDYNNTQAILDRFDDSDIAGANAEIVKYYASKYRLDVYDGDFADIEDMRGLYDAIKKTHVLNSYYDYCSIKTNAKREEKSLKTNPDADDTNIRDRDRLWNMPLDSLIDELDMHFSYESQRDMLVNGVGGDFREYLPLIGVQDDGSVNHVAMNNSAFFVANGYFFKRGVELSHQAYYRASMSANLINEYIDSARNNHKALLDIESLLTNFEMLAKSSASDHKFSDFNSDKSINNLRKEIWNNILFRRPSKELSVEDIQARKEDARRFYDAWLDVVIGRNIDIPVPEDGSVRMDTPADRERYDVRHGFSPSHVVKYASSVLSDDPRENTDVIKHCLASMRAEGAYRSTMVHDSYKFSYSDYVNYALNPDSYTCAVEGDGDDLTMDDDDEVRAESGELSEGGQDNEGNVDGPERSVELSNARQIRNDMIGFDESSAKTVRLQDLINAEQRLFLSRFDEYMALPDRDARTAYLKQFSVYERSVFVSLDRLIPKRSRDDVRADNMSIDNWVESNGASSGITRDSLRNYMISYSASFDGVSKMLNVYASKGISDYWFDRSTQKLRADAEVSNPFSVFNDQYFDSKSKVPFMGRMVASAMKTMVETGCDPSTVEIGVDANGIMCYKGSGSQSEDIGDPVAGHAKKITGYIGQIIAPGKYGELDCRKTHDKIFVCGYDGYVEPYDPINPRLLNERLHVYGYESRMLNELTREIRKGVLSYGPEYYFTPKTTVLNRVYSAVQKTAYEPDEFYVRMGDPDYVNNSPNKYDDINVSVFRDAVKNASRNVRFSSSCIENNTSRCYILLHNPNTMNAFGFDANRTSTFGSNMRAPSELITGGSSVAELTPEEAANYLGGSIVDPYFVSTAKTQGIRLILCDGVRVSSIDSTVVPVPTPAGRSALAANEHVQYTVESDPLDRADMFGNNINEHKYIMAKTAVAYMTMNGGNFDDGIIVSASYLINKGYKVETEVDERFLNRHMVDGKFEDGFIPVDTKGRNCFKAADGKWYRCLDTNDKLSDFHGNKGTITRIIDGDYSAANLTKLFTAAQGSDFKYHSGYGNKLWIGEREVETEAERDEAGNIIKKGSYHYKQVDPRKLFDKESTGSFKIIVNPGELNAKEIVIKRSKRKNSPNDIIDSIVNKFQSKYRIDEGEANFAYENPNIDLVMSPYSGISRGNAGMVRSCLDNNADASTYTYADPFGERHTNTAGVVDILVLNKFSDDKTHDYSDNPDKGRKGSSMLIEILNSRGAFNTIRALTAHNDQPYIDARMWAKAINLDFDECMRPNVGQVRQYGENVRQLNLPDGDELLDSLRIDRAKSNVRYSSDKFHINAISATSLKSYKQLFMSNNFDLLDKGGYMELPFTLKSTAGIFAFGNDDAMRQEYLRQNGISEDEYKRYQSDYVRKIGKPLKTEEDYDKFYSSMGMPSFDMNKLFVVPGSMRASRELNDGSVNSHMYNTAYMDIYEDVCLYTYYDKLDKLASAAADLLNKSGRNVAVSNANNELTAFGRFKAIFDNSFGASGRGRKSSKVINDPGVSDTESFKETWLANIETVQKICAKAKESCHTHAQSVYDEKIVREVSQRQFVSKHGFMHDGILAVDIDKSATVNCGSDHRLGVGEVGMSSKMAVSLGLYDRKNGKLVPHEPFESEDDVYIGVIRDPMLNDGNLRYMKVVIDDTIPNGIRINSVSGKSFDGDYDGDTYGLLNLVNTGNEELNKSVHEELKREFKTAANLLNYSEPTGDTFTHIDAITKKPIDRVKFPLYFNLELECAVKMYRDPELQKRHDDLVLAVNDAYYEEDDYRAAGKVDSFVYTWTDDKGNECKLTGEDAFQKRKDVLCEQVSDLSRDLLSGVGISAIDYTSAKTMLKSFELCWVQNGKGNANKLKQLAYNAGITYKTKEVTVGDYFGYDKNDPAHAEDFKTKIDVVDMDTVKIGLPPRKDPEKRAEVTEADANNLRNAAMRADSTATGGVRKQTLAMAFFNRDPAVMRAANNLSYNITQCILQAKKKDGDALYIAKELSTFEKDAFDGKPVTNMDAVMGKDMLRAFSHFVIKIKNDVDARNALSAHPEWLLHTAHADEVERARVKSRVETQGFGATSKNNPYMGMSKSEYGSAVADFGKNSVLERAYSSARDGGDLKDDYYKDKIERNRNYNGNEDEIALRVKKNLYVNQLCAVFEAAGVAYSRRDIETIAGAMTRSDGYVDGISDTIENPSPTGKAKGCFMEQACYATGKNSMKAIISEAFKDCKLKHDSPNCDPAKLRRRSLIDGLEVYGTGEYVEANCDNADDKKNVSIARTAYEAGMSKYDKNVRLNSVNVATDSVRERAKNSNLNGCFGGNGGCEYVVEPLVPKGYNLTHDEAQKIDMEKGTLSIYGGYKSYKQPSQEMVSSRHVDDPALVHPLDKPVPSELEQPTGRRRTRSTPAD